MATVLNFTIEQTDNAKELIFKETTGAYDGSNNTDGWGTPNELTSDAVTVTLSVTKPGDSAATDYTSTEISGLGSYPTTDTGAELPLTTDDLGGSSDVKHTDGIYTFTYTIVTGTTTYTTTHKVFVSGQVRCCVYEMLANVDEVDCDCDSTEKAYALEAFTFYRSLIANASCGNETKYTSLLALTNKLCESNKC